MVVILVIFLYKECVNVTTDVYLYKVKDTHELLFEAVVLNIVYSEGLSLKEYVCESGKSTIGFGTKPDDGTNSVYDFNRAKKDFAKHFRGAFKKSLRYDKLTSAQQLALTSFFYNVTPETTSNLQRYLINGDSLRIVTKLKEYVYAKNEKLKGLEDRRLREIYLFVNCNNRDSLNLFIEQIQPLALKKIEQGLKKQ